MTSNLVSTIWLRRELGSPDLSILDASFFLPADGRDARTEFDAAHIPGAKFFDLAQMSDLDSPLPNMLPSAADFADRVGALGVSDRHRIIIYDNSPHHSSARAWWMFRVFGAPRVAILDGGLPQWRAEGLPLDTGDEQAVTAHFQANFDAGLVRSLAEMVENLRSQKEQVVDARSLARFAGSLPEPRLGVSPGHIPRSYNLPHEAMFSDGHVWKEPDQLRAAFEAADVDLTKAMTMTCGSGVTASVLAFAANELGAAEVALYDGSWAEWGADPATPKAPAL